MVPITREVAIQLSEPPEGVDRSLWLYELCRFLTMKVNNLIIAFFAENPPCSSQTCPEMRASEWQYLCAVHDPPKSCCAIDYCCHTLDWAVNTLTSPKYFPSRLTLGAETAGGPQASMRHLTNIFRRLYRIFAHAWYQHRDVFWEVEGHDGLYVFFKTVCDMYSLIPPDNYTVPREAEGADAVSPASEEPVDNRRLTILRKEDENQFSDGVEGLDPALGAGATTRRHKSSPSTGSRVTTITESAEDLDEMQNPFPLTEPPTTALRSSMEDNDHSPLTEKTPTENVKVDVQADAQQSKEETAPTEEKPVESAEEQAESERAQVQQPETKAEEKMEQASEDDEVTPSAESVPNPLDVTSEPSSALEPVPQPETAQES